MATPLEKRVALLEAAGGGDGCPRCSGALVVRNAVTGEFFRAKETLSGKRISEEELRERESEEKCSRCGRVMDTYGESVIEIGKPIAGPREGFDSRRAAHEWWGRD